MVCVCVYMFMWVPCVHEWEGDVLCTFLQVDQAEGVSFWTWVSICNQTNKVFFNSLYDRDLYPGLVAAGSWDCFWVHM